MHEAAREWSARCRDKLRTGAITAEDLDRLDVLLAEPRQQILYLYSKSTNMRSQLASWALYDATRPQGPTLPGDEPPYESVLAAVADGWRVVQFPMAKLYAYEGQDNDYLGYEFVLEKLVQEKESS
ncbi:MAG: hypothetical protein OXG13_14275 [Gemmatimonadaceae bacterium]|nr:hypothetical protein [Gemmatimonadaceae bacterium]